MYSDSDLNDAVSAGVLSREAADAFRTHVATVRQAPMVDEEQFRLVTGFNDIFVVIAVLLGYVALGQLGGRSGGLLIAAASWGLAEFFTRQRRMALPSIVLVGGFVLGLFIGVMGLLDTQAGIRDSALQPLIAGAVATAGAVAHWMRFRVPITVAAITGAATLTLVAAVLSPFGDNDATVTRILPWLLLAAGLAIFAFAMRWDLSDPERRTRRSDVAFWLHLLSAPMIAHPIFYALGLTGGLFGFSSVAEQAGPLAALAAVALYFAFGLVAVIVDRRALLVSGLAYVLYAFYRLVQGSVSVELGFALSALVIASALLLLSAFWSNVRAVVLGWLPEGLRARLPHGIAVVEPVSSPA